MSVLIRDQEVTLTGSVGVDWFDDGFTHAEVVTALANLEGDITVRLNSGGGIASEGAAIYATLVTYDGDVSLVVEGIAASAASLIAMAGDTITMAEGAVMMIHDPMNITIGNSADHAKTIEELEAYAKSYARIYAKRSGMTEAAAREIMKAETWYDGEAAIKAGFADDPGGKRPDRAKASAFDYRVYAKAPARLATAAKTNKWLLADHITDPTTSAATSANKTEEASMPTDKERADALAAELATMKTAFDAKEAELATAKTAAKPAPAAVDTATAVAEAVKADRTRRASVMALPEAKGREAQAEKLALSTMSIDEIKDVLGVGPTVTPESTDAYEVARLAGAALVGATAASAKADNHGWGKVVAKYGVAA